jgi:UDP-2,4-diacetamido-2,4,6-trideoxy-beta-L-altropyranose hydrolase
MKFAFRTDASTGLGLGHLKRCLALGHVLRSRGAGVHFFLRGNDVDGAELAAVQGFSSTTLALGATQGEVADATAFVHAARSVRTARPDVVVVDHYGLGARWQRAVRGALDVRMAAIDDLGDRQHDVDVLVDHNLCSDTKYASRISAEAHLLTGPRYALLGPTYTTTPHNEAAAQVRSIGICMGGADALNLNETALDACRALAGFGGDIEIATTTANPHLERLRARLLTDPRTRLSLDQPDLAAFFARHDLHIGAGGGSTWERCCLGAPTLAVIAADNQRPVLLPLRELGVLELVDDDPATADPMARALQALLGDARHRAALGRNARKLVDGLGAERVADQLFLLLP